MSPAEIIRSKITKFLPTTKSAEQFIRSAICSRSF